MTNFEKWKTGLTPEDLLLPSFLDGGTILCVHVDCENDCPAYKSCPMYKAHRAKKFDLGRVCLIADDCHKHFLRWANAEAEEDGK